MYIYYIIIAYVYAVHISCISDLCPYTHTPYNIHIHELNYTQLRQNQTKPTYQINKSISDMILAVKTSAKE